MEKKMRKPFPPTFPGTFNYVGVFCVQCTLTFLNMYLYQADNVCGKWYCNWCGPSASYKHILPSICWIWISFAECLGSPLERMRRPSERGSELRGWDDLAIWLGRLETKVLGHVPLEGNSREGTQWKDYVSQLAEKCKRSPWKSWTESLRRGYSRAFCFNYYLSDPTQIRGRRYLYRNINTGTVNMVWLTNY